MNVTDQDLLNEGFEIHDHSDKPGGHKIALKFPMQVLFKNGKWRHRFTEVECLDVKKEYEDKLKTVKKYKT